MKSVAVGWPLLSWHVRSDDVQPCHSRLVWFGSTQFAASLKIFRGLAAGSPVSV